MKRFLGAALAVVVVFFGFTNPVSANADVLVDKTYVEGTDQQAFLFNPLQVNRVDITMTPADEAALRQDPRIYQPATIKLTTELGATRVYNVGLHIKGGWGSYRSLEEKTGFKVKVDFSVKGQNIYGIKKFTLNNMVQDTSMLHEATAYRLFRAMGVPAPRVGYANVYFNGVSYGLHSNIETYDKVSLARWYPGGTAQLFEGAYGVEVGPQMQMDEGTLGDTAEISALQDLNNTLSGQEWFDAIRDKVDLNEMINDWAVEHYIGHWDGYTRGWPNNYYVYKPKGGAWAMLPWGTDQTWVTWNALIDDGATMMTRCVNYAPCRELYDTALAQIQTRVANLGLPTMVDKIWAKIGPSVNVDPRKPYSYQEAIDAVGRTKTFMNDRFAELVSHNGSRLSSSISAIYPQNQFVLQGIIRPKLSVTGDGVLSFRKIEGNNICDVNSVTGAVTILNSGVCRVAASITQTSNYHGLMVISRIVIPKMATRILVSPYSPIRAGRSATLGIETETSGAVRLRVKSGACKVTGKTVKALAGTGKCLITISAAGDESYLAASKTITVSLRK